MKSSRFAGRSPGFHDAGAYGGIHGPLRFLPYGLGFGGERTLDSVERWTPKTGRKARSQKCHSLAHKYSVFTALLLAYVVLIFFAFDYWTGSFNPVKVVALCLTTLLAIGAISKYTNRILARPVRNLQKGITAVREGRLEPIQVSRTGDEIEFLGESFNGMISDLAASREEVRQSQESLEEKIHERTRALEKVSQEALAASHAKSEFLANMSHELRTPMNGVLGMIEILLDGNIDDEQQEQLQTARGCANTLLALLNDVLDLSKIEAGKMEIEEVPYRVTTVIRECVRTLEPKAMEKGIELRSLIHPEVPSRIAGDPLRFRQIVTNLLSNAVKFTESGCVEVELEVEPAAGSGPKVLILRVTDTGSGIPRDRLPHIFDEFTQADGSISRKYGGTGLGLTITRKLAEMQGGRITVESVVGRGSCFRVVLPCHPVCCLEDACKDEPAGPSMSSHEETEDCRQGRHPHRRGQSGESEGCGGHVEAPRVSDRNREPRWRGAVHIGGAPHSTHPHGRANANGGWHRGDENHP